MPYASLDQFLAETKFEDRAGFKLSKKQRELVEQSLPWIKLLNRGEVGCGKTVLSTVTSMMHSYDVTVVTVPPILIDGWVNWLNQVSERVVAYEGKPKVRKELQKQFSTARWIVCSHAIFRDDYTQIMTPIMGRKYEIIVDEAHWMKNHQSHLFNKVRYAVSGDRGCQMLTGTPTSKPDDAYAYIKIKTPNAYRNYEHFCNVHIAERDFYKRPVAFAHLEKLGETLNLQTITATKEEVHGYNLKPLMPDCSYHLDEKHQRLYEKLVEEQLLQYDDGTVLDATTIQKLQHAMQQIVVNWEHFSRDPKDRSMAYQLLDQTVDETECYLKGKSKLIIWTKYKMTSAKVTEYLLARGIPTVAAYSGSDSKAAAKAFMEDDNCRALVAQPQSAGAGLNPQYVCWESLFMEIDTVPIYARQAFGRTDRMGQTRTPRIKIGVAKNTVQVRLYNQLIKNDSLIAPLEPDRKSLREMLLGQR